MNTTHIISSKSLDLATIQSIILEQKQLELSSESVDKINECRTYLNEKLKMSNINKRSVYVEMSIK